MSHILLKIVGTANGLSLPSNNGISLGLASTSNTGALASADWNTFNNKANTASPTFTGMLTSQGPISLAASQGMIIETGAPGITTNALYQVAGNLYFNGVQLAAGGINLSSAITGFVLGTDDAALTATDTVLQAFQKIQVQINTKASNAPRISTPTYAATMTPASADFDLIRISLTGALTLNLNTGTISDGHKLIVELKQDATGTRLVTLGTGIMFGTDIPSFVATTTANKTDLLGFVYSFADSKYRLVSVAKGY